MSQIGPNDNDDTDRNTIYTNEGLHEKVKTLASNLIKKLLDENQQIYTEIEQYRQENKFDQIPQHYFDNFYYNAELVDSILNPQNPHHNAIAERLRERVIISLEYQQTPQTETNFEQNDILSNRANNFGEEIEAVATDTEDIWGSNILEEI